MGPSHGGIRDTTLRNERARTQTEQTAPSTADARPCQSPAPGEGPPHGIPLPTWHGAGAKAMGPWQHGGLRRDAG